MKKPWLTYLTIGISIVVFLLHMRESDPWEYETMKRWGVLGAWDIYGGGWWSLVTSVFVHADVLHVGFNLYWLWILGRAVERAIGPLRWLALFVGAAWVSSASLYWSTRIASWAFFFFPLNVPA